MTFRKFIIGYFITYSMNIKLFIDNKDSHVVPELVVELYVLFCKIILLFLCYCLFYFFKNKPLLLYSIFYQNIILKQQ